MINPCTYIDGIASSQAIDTAGEIVDIMGLDCSSLLGAAFNFEHKSDLPAQIVGKVLEFKKIFSEDDCDTDRQRYYWGKVNMPFLYVLGRLFDDKKESSKEIAALFRDDAENPNEPKMVGFSIEGAKVNKEGMTITRSIARKVTITNMPANKTCIAEMVPATKKSGKADLESIFKGEIEFFNPNAKYLEFLQKKEQSMEKDVGTGGGAFIGDSLAMSEMKKSLPWSPFKPVKTAAGVSSVSSSHAEHGMVGIHSNPTGGFDVKHQGKLVSSHPNAQHAMAGAQSYQQKISSGKTLSPQMHNRASPQMPSMGKSMTAGNSNVAPGQLEGGAALAKEAPIGHLSQGKDDQKPKQATSVRIGMGHGSSVSMSSSGTGGGSMMMMSSKKEKSAWLARAEEAYKVWEKREQFESFMKSKMPHMTKGEIKAIGQTLALKKSVEAEKAMSKMYTSFFGKTDK